jgi:hypothetical protein
VNIIKFVVQQINIRHSYIVYMAPDIPNFGYPTCSRDTFDQNNIARISPIIQKARHMCHMPSPRWLINRLPVSTSRCCQLCYCTSAPQAELHAHTHQAREASLPNTDC